MGANQGSYTDSKTNCSVNIQKLNKISDHQDFEVLEDSAGNLYEKYQIFIQGSSSIQQQFKKYQLREGHHDYLVNVYSCRIINRYPKEPSYLQILTERICLTLNQQSRITVQNGLNILLDAAKGFEIIFQKIGSFQINDELIGFNAKGKVKVWINNNWAMNQKIKTLENSNYEINESHMILQLLQSVEKHIKTCPLMIRWLQQRASIKIWSFLILKKFISKFSFLNKIRSKHNFMQIGSSKEEIKIFKDSKINHSHQSKHQVDQISSKVLLKNNPHSLSSFISQIKSNTPKMANKKIDFNLRNDQPVFLSFDNKRKNKSGKLKNKKNLIFKSSYPSSERGRINKLLGQYKYQPNTQKMKVFQNSLSKQQIINEGNTVQTLVSEFTIQLPKDNNIVSLSLQKNRKLQIKTQQDQYLLTTKTTQRNQQNHYFKLIESNQKSLQFKKGIVKRKKNYKKTKKIEINQYTNPASHQQSFEEFSKRNSNPNLYKLNKNEHKKRKVEFSLDQKVNQKKERFSLSPNVPHQSGISSKMRSVDQSILIQTNKKQDTSIITLINKHMNIESGIQNQDQWQIQFHAQSQQSLPIKSLRLKSIMTQSITLINSIKKDEIRDNEKSLSKLDKIMICQQKAKSREDILNESVHVKYEPGNKTQLREKAFHA